jgi:hypothetical protein
MLLAEKHSLLLKAFLYPHNTFTATEDIIRHLHESNSSHQRQSASGENYSSPPVATVQHEDHAVASNLVLSQLRQGTFFDV